MNILLPVILMTTLTLNCKEHNANTMLMSAVDNNDPQEVKNALAAGADVHTRMDNGQTILMMACVSSFKQELVPGGKPACCHDCEDAHAPWRTAWQKLLEDRRAIITILLQAGARVHDCDDEGKSVLHIACICNNDPRKVQLLIDAGARVNAVDKAGRTPLMEAIADGDSITAEKLKVAGAVH